MSVQKSHSNKLPSVKLSVGSGVSVGNGGVVGGSGVSVGGRTASGVGVGVGTVVGTGVGVGVGGTAVGGIGVCVAVGAGMEVGVGIGVGGIGEGLGFTVGIDVGGVLTAGWRRVSVGGGVMVGAARVGATPPGFSHAKTSDTTIMPNANSKRGRFKSLVINYGLSNQVCRVDDTYLVLYRVGCKLIRHRRNLAYGGALPSWFPIQL